MSKMVNSRWNRVKDSDYSVEEITKSSTSLDFQLKHLNDEESAGYAVSIGTVPICSCPNYRKHPDDICKHILWLYYRYYGTSINSVLPFQPRLSICEWNAWYQYFYQEKEYLPYSPPRNLDLPLNSSPDKPPSNQDGTATTSSSFEDRSEDGAEDNPEDNSEDSSEASVSRSPDKVFNDLQTENTKQIVKKPIKRKILVSSSEDEKDSKPTTKKKLDIIKVTDQFF